MAKPVTYSLEKKKKKLAAQAATAGPSHDTEDVTTSRKRQFASRLVLLSKKSCMKRANNKVEILTL
jgi:hypothetical protein